TRSNRDWSSDVCSSDLPTGDGFTVLRTGHIIRAGGWVPLVSGIAVLALSVVKPSPVGVNHHLAVNVGTRAATRTLLPGQLGVNQIGRASCRTSACVVEL